MVNVDKEQLDAALRLIARKAAEELSGRVAGRVGITPSIEADESGAYSVVVGGDALRREYGTFEVEPDPWAIVTMMEMERNG